jgi:protein-tyrosine-phosphatase
MGDHPFNVLFLCTGNSARSIIAEAILNKVGAGRFRAFIAPRAIRRGKVHPETIRLLQSLDYDTSGFRSKSWDEFIAPKYSISCSQSATTRGPQQTPPSLSPSDREWHVIGDDAAGSTSGTTV